MTCNRWIPIGSPDRELMNWALILFKNSCTDDLKEKINMKYEGLQTHFKGPVTYLWILFDELFSTNSDQIQALKLVFTYFEQKGLRKYPGEAVPRASVPTLAAARRLWSIGQLETTQVKSVLKGFTECSVPTFAKILRACWSRTNKPVSSLALGSVVLLDSLPDTMTMHIRFELV